jgi:hypothetical protein
MTKLERLEARLAKVNEKIFWLEMIDRLHGDEKKEYYIRCRERMHLYREINEIKGIATRV